MFYISTEGNLMAAEVNERGAALEVGQPRALLGNMPVSSVPSMYDVAPGGQRFLLVYYVEPAAASEPLTLVQNWTALLKK